MLVQSLQTKSRTRLARDVSDTFATHASLVYDVTDRPAGHKMAALTVVFSRLSDFDLNVKQH